MSLPDQDQRNPSLGRLMRFRGWSIDFNCWITPNSIEVWDNTGVLKAFQGGQYIIEQATGIKDQNGLDIYEGDIVDFSTYARFPLTPQIHLNQEVWYDPEVAAWVFGRSIFPHCDEPFPYGRTIGGNHIDATTFVVRGNIHEHKHLLSK